MLTIKLAFRNITHAGLRTLLNVFILSFAFVLIIWVQGMYDGMMRQVKHDMIEMDVGGGQFWQQKYDQYDPLTLEDAHAPLSAALRNLVGQGKATPILITSSAIFPEGRVTPALLKGIDPDNKILGLPSGKLKDAKNFDAIPAIIGSRMSRDSKLKVGDYVTARWRDLNGTFDATEVKIVYVFSTVVQTVDPGQIWIPLSNLQEMVQMPGQATIVVVAKDYHGYVPGSPDWIFRDHTYLFREIDTLVKTKKTASSTMYLILLAMALLAVFDTQVLAIFHRRKEMGTLMALGMTRGKVIRLFTMEGALQGLLAILIGALYGIPFLAYQAAHGIPLPDVIEQTGFSMGLTMYPVYGVPLFIGTSILLFVSVVIVSFLPTRKIAKLKPTDALRGKMP